MKLSGLLAKYGISMQRLSEVEVVEGWSSDADSARGVLRTEDGVHIAIYIRKTGES